MNIQESTPEQLQQAQQFNPEPSPNYNEYQSIQQQPSHINDLMQSIENKLSMLACEDSIQEFQTSKIISPKKEIMTATDEKRKHPRMFIHDLELETSNRKNMQYGQQQCANTQPKEKTVNSQLGESRIVSRINQIENFYMDRIQLLSHKISMFEFDYQQLQKRYTELERINSHLQHSLSVKQKIQKDHINKKVEEIKKQLIKKFSKEAEEHFQSHLNEMKILTEELTEEKKRRRSLEHENSLLRNEKINLQKFYRDLLHDHRQMIRIDIEKGYKNTLEEGIMKEKYWEIPSKSQQKINFVEKINSPEEKTTKKKKGKKFNSSSIHNNNAASITNKSQRKQLEQEMSKQEMIPYLAKGIQELKEKLKLK